MQKEIKKKKKKNQGKGMWHVGKREEVSSFENTIKGDS